MANKKDYMEGCERYYIGFCLIFIAIAMVCFVAALDYKLDKLEENISSWTEWDNGNSFDECCLNGNKLICPNNFVKVAVIFINGSEARLDYSSFKMCNTHTSFALVSGDEQ